MKLMRRQVVGGDGAVLDCMHTVVDPRKRTVLIALPFGVPATVARAAFDKFGPNFNVATWESRYVLNLDLAFSGDEELGPENHVADIVRLLHSLQAPSCSLIGYCSGAGISLLAARMHPDIFTELILVNGEYQLFRSAGQRSTSYQRSIDTFLPEVAKSRQTAKAIFATMAEVSQASVEAKPAEQTELDRQINLPFSKVEHLFRYARNYMAYRDFDALGVASGISQSTFVLTGRMDQHSCMEHSEAVAAKISGARTFVDDKGDHYEFCKSGSLTLSEIDDYMVLPQRVLS